MNEEPFSLAAFLGNFHPVLVHLPIGGLIVVGILEVLSKFSRFKDAARANRLILAITVGGFLAAGLCGWFLAQTSGYDQQLLRWHRWSGFSVAVASLLTLMMSLRRWQPFYHVCLFATLAMLMVASHLGGSITHGPDFLTRNAPGWARPSRGTARPAAVQVVNSDRPRQRVFEVAIQPILLERCSECHGPAKQKGGLRLDTLEGLLRGGANGPVLAPGKADDSEIIRRLLLPEEHDDHMPPQGKPQLTPGEIALLQWWINTGVPDQPLQTRTSR